MNIPQSVTRAVGKAVVAAKKNEPHILFAGGVVGVVTSTVLACRATLKAAPVIEETKGQVAAVKMLHSDRTPGDGRAEQGYRKDLARTYGYSVSQLARLYGPSILIGGLSIGALTRSHIQLTRRNAALTAAYATLSQVFDEYRERVKEEIGAEREEDLYLNMKETVVDKDGKKVTVKAPDGLPNQFARIFDKNCRNWKPSPEYNRYFLQEQQNYANQRLNAYGTVFLNDVYDWLGFDRTQIGQLVGWTVNSEHGPGYISFGLDSAFNTRQDSSMHDGWALLLDFNVEGVVYDHL